jgi:chemotaxis protein methyltransferase CheR
MALPESRTPDLRRALERAVAEASLPDARALLGVLSSKALAGDLLDTMISALNVSETHLFRGAPQIQALEQRILPELVDRRRREQRLRIWSAACSTGEEAYTLAILLSRVLRRTAEWDVLVLATDINGDALERARRGLYSAWSLRGAPEFVRTTYLAPVGDRFEIVPQIRGMVTFSRLNLAEDTYPSVSTNTQDMDLIVCRNVLIYFDEEGARAVVRRLRDALAEGGWLILGPVEARFGALDGLVADASETAVYRRLPIPTGQMERAAPIAAPPTAPRQTVARPPRPEHPPSCPVELSSPHGAPAFEEALVLWRAARSEEALRRLEAEAERHPLAAQLHYLTGMILLEQERTGEALAAFRRCTYADPAFALGHLAQAIVFARRGSPRRAGIALDNAARLVADLDPDDAGLLEADGLTPRDVLALVAVQRELLAPERPAATHV